MDKSIFDTPEWYDDLQSHKEIAERLKNGDYTKTVKIDPEIFPESKIAKELSEMKQDMREQRTKEEAEKPKDKRFQIFNSLVSGAAGSLITLFAEHHKAILSFLSDKIEIILNWITGFFK